MSDLFIIFASQIFAPMLLYVLMLVGLFTMIFILYDK